MSTRGRGIRPSSLALSGVLAVVFWLRDCAPTSFGWIAPAQQRRRLSLAAMQDATVVARPQAADELLRLLDAEASKTGRGSGLSASDRKRVFQLATELEANGGGVARVPGGQGSKEEPLGGTWRLLFQGIDGPPVSATSLDSWKNYFSGKGPSPLQNLVTTDTASVGSVYQALELQGSEKITGGSFVNLIDFSPTGCLEISASLEGEIAPSRLSFRFQGGEFRFRALWNGTIILPYPVPFKLLGDNAVGWLETIYLDKELRISKGNKGSLFVLKRDDKAAEVEGSLLRGSKTRASKLLGGEWTAAAVAPGVPVPESAILSTSNAGTSLSRDPVVVCPAQFGTPDDYDEFVQALKERGHPVFVAPLTKFSWFELVPSFLSKEYWTGELEPGKVLQFYYRALEAAFNDAKAHISANGGQGKVHFVAHSIGGWVARAFLGEVLAPRGDIRLVASLVTLGTPHEEPPKDSFVAAADQTRGLLKNINSRFPGSFHASEGVKYIAVGSADVPGQLPLPFQEKPRRGWIESILAWASYLALAGDGGVKGDGITPLLCALLPGDSVQHIRLGEDGKPGCFHANYLPSPGPSIRLEGAPWYGNGEALDEWLKFIQ